MRNFVLIVTVLVTFFTSIFLSDSYLSLHQVSISLICKCNHSSHNEIHSTSSLLLEEHSNLFSNEDKLPSCHSSNKNGVHLCSCKKSSDNLVHIFFQKSAIIESKINLFSLCLTDKYFIGITLHKVLLAKGFSYLVTPPPKSII